MVTRFATTVTEEKPQSVKPLTDGKTGALLATYKNGVKAVIKPVKETLPNGKTMQRGIPVRTHPYREVAYYLLAKMVGFDDLVPETVLTHKAVDAWASAQVFMPAYHLRQLQSKLADTHRKDWSELLIKTALRVPKLYWRQLVALDIIAGTRDRHASNVGILMRIGDNAPIYRLVAWDNAVTFGLTFERYHNVFHKFLFRKTIDFGALWPALDKLTLERMNAVLGPYLTDEEIRHAYMRLCFFRDYPYRLPWRVVSEGTDSPHDFPDYAAYFEPVVETSERVVAPGQPRV